MSKTSSVLSFGEFWESYWCQRFDNFQYVIEIATRVKWRTRPSVNYVKDFLFCIPGLVWKRVSPSDAIIRAQSAAISCIWPFLAWWRMNGQPGDPIASLLLTSEKAVFCDVANAQRKSKTIDLHWEPILISQSHFSKWQRLNNRR